MKKYEDIPIEMMIDYNGDVIFREIFNDQKEIKRFNLVDNDNHIKDLELQKQAMQQDIQILKFIIYIILAINIIMLYVLVIK